MHPLIGRLGSLAFTVALSQELAQAARQLLCGRLFSAAAPRLSADVHRTPYDLKRELLFGNTYLKFFDSVAAHDGRRQREASLYTR